MEEVREIKAYTYYLYHVPTGKKYYGYRWGNKCDPENDLWNKYFSSSKLVKKFIKDHGRDSFIAEVRKVFDCREAAHEYEQRFLHRVKAVEKTDWLNQAYDHGPFYSNISGTKRSEKTRQALRIAWETREPDSEETRARKKKAKAGVHVGEKNPMYGKPPSPESIAKGIETKKRNGTTSAGSNNGMYGRRMRWIYHPETGLIKRIDITEVLPIGWVFGMSPIQKRNIKNGMKNNLHSVESEQKRVATRKKNRMLKLLLKENK